MKKISLLIVLLGMGVLLLGSGQAASIRPAILGGAYDELLPEAVKGKPFVPSFRVKWEYDDNVYAGDEGWKLYLEPKIDLHWLSADTYLGLSYQYSFIWYDDRADDNDMSHDALFDVRHFFSPGLEVVLRDLFRMTQEPAFPEDFGDLGREVSYRTMGDYIYNRFSVAANLQTGRAVWWNWSYSNLMIDYDEDWPSMMYDRMAHTGAVKLQYDATAQSKINAGVRYTDTSYDEEVGKDSEGWIGYVGLDQQLTRHCVGSVMAGWEDREFSDIDASDDAPYVDVRLSSKLGKKGNGHIGYRHNFAETEWPTFSVREVNAFYGGLNAWMADWTSVHVHTSYEMGELQPMLGGPEADEDVWLMGAALRQHVSKDIYLEAGYRRTDVDGDLAGTSYDRNRYYVGVGGIF